MKNHLSKVFVQYLDSINFEDKSVVEVLKAKDVKFGDYSTNIAMRLTKALGKAPMEIAEDIKTFIEAQNNPEIAEVTATNPGFVNLFLATDFITENAMKFVDEGFKPEFTTITPKKVNYEYVSANPTGDLHIGHARNAIVGDVSINALKYVGHTVRTEYWINDGGVQMTTLAKSVFFYYAPLVGIETSLTAEDVGYHGIEIKTFAKQLADDNFELKGSTEDEQIESMVEACGVHFLDEIKRVLGKDGLNIQPFDNWQSEAWTLVNKFPEVFAKLKEIDAIYEKDGATWIRSGDHGDEKDRVLIKSDGSYTYMAADVAYHIIKLDEGRTDLLIDLWGKDHHGYEPRVQAALAAVGMPGKMEVDFISMVAVMNNGEAFKMSKRAGTSVRIREILEDMPRDIFRYSLITKGKEQNMEIDLALITQEDSNNPYYYTQYANARVNQILEKATEVASTDKTDLLGKEDKERELMSKMIEFEDLMITMEKEREPSLIVNYQKELTQAFNSYYAVCKVITEDAELSAQRVMLMKAVRNLFNTIFNLLGIDPIKKL